MELLGHELPADPRLSAGPLASGARRVGVGAAREAMELLGHDLLADPRLAEDQDGEVADRDLLGGPVALAHRRIGYDGLPLGGEVGLLLLGRDLALRQELAGVLAVGGEV